MYTVDDTKIVQIILVLSKLQLCEVLPNCVVVFSYTVIYKYAAIKSHSEDL